MFDLLIPAVLTICFMILVGVLFKTDKHEAQAVKAHGYQHGYDAGFAAGLAEGHINGRTAGQAEGRAQLYNDLGIDNSALATGEAP